jgi:hypothetical protein
LKKTGRIWGLARSVDELDTFEDFDAVQLSGRFVAWYGEYLDLCRYGCPPWYDSFAQSLETVDLRSGEERRVELPDYPAGMQLRVDAQGAIAWPVWLPHNQVAVRIRDAAGERAVAQLSRLRVSLNVRAIRFRLSEYATVRFTIRRRKGARSVPLKGSFTDYGLTGMNFHPFDRRLRGRALPRGNYLLVARATDYAGHHSQTLRAKFRIPKRR